MAATGVDGAAAKGVSYKVFGLGLGIYGPILLASIVGAGGYLGYRYWKKRQEEDKSDKKAPEKNPVLTPRLGKKPEEKAKESITPVKADKPVAPAAAKKEETTDNKIKNALQSTASKNFTLKLSDKKKAVDAKAALKPKPVAPKGAPKPVAKKPAPVPTGKGKGGATPVTKTGNRKK